MGGRKYTFMSSDGARLSKIDRMFVCERFMSSWPNASLLALERDVSDHSPLVLSICSEGFGPIPFRFFNSWLGNGELDDLVNRGLGSDVGSGPRNFILGKRLKVLKSLIRDWRNKKRCIEDRELAETVARIRLLENTAEGRGLGVDERKVWKELKWKIWDFEAKKLKDALQKAKLKWLTDGDENTKFFHGVANSKRVNNKVDGLYVNDAWETRPEVIKKVVVDFFANKFSEPAINRPKMTGTGFRKISDSNATLLVEPFSNKEIRDAVWECGADKSPGPDGFSFAFIKHYWVSLEPHFWSIMDEFYTHGTICKSVNSSFVALIPKVVDPMTLSDYRPISLIGSISKIVTKVLANRLKVVLDSIISPEQSAFVKGRNILDGPLIINEVVNWAKKSKKRILVFKVDFEKAYDCVSWKFLVNTMHHMGFPSRWKNWIMGILFTGRASVLINGSPTEEFELKRGLRQGDPLSPFLFTLVMEALHVMVAKAVEAGTFVGVKLPHEGPCLSHLFYADDALFVGEWSETNLRNLNRILRCFQMASGLNVNLSKSKVYGVGVEDMEASNLAYILGCQKGSFPFVYLGLSVGANMNRVASWKVIVDRFNAKLSLWKARLLSFAGRVTLIKSVLGTLANYYLSMFKAPSGVIKTLEGIRRRFLWGGSSLGHKIRWVAWNRILRSKKHGGLGVGGIKDLNLGLMSKWWWRFRTCNDQLWSNVIKAIHDNGRGVDLIPHKNSLGGTWKGIAAIKKEFQKMHMDLNAKFFGGVGDGKRLRFWVDQWVQGGSLKTQFPSLYNLAHSKQALIEECYITESGSEGWKVKWKRSLNSPQELDEEQRLLAVLSLVSLSNTPDNWQWYSENKKVEFSVKQVRLDIAKTSQPTSLEEHFKWCKIAVSKVNHFAWRAGDGRIPTTSALAARNVAVGDGRCPMCGFADEDADHLLVACSYAKMVWRRICEWVKLPIPSSFDSVKQILDYVQSSSLAAKRKKVVYSIFLLTLWQIWLQRNNKIFKGCRANAMTTVEDIKDNSFWWMVKRAKLSGVNEDSWNNFEELDFG
ncbi:putative RNA-directed DNA polymerase [Helianthus annuus]|nr:putative RNA-directed DNA polymerase [Helianthus annuus]